MCACLQNAKPNSKWLREQLFTLYLYNIFVDKAIFIEIYFVRPNEYLCSFSIYSTHRIWIKPYNNNNSWQKKIKWIEMKLVGLTVSNNNKWLNSSSSYGKSNWILSTTTFYCWKNLIAFESIYIIVMFEHIIIILAKIEIQNYAFVTYCDSNISLTQSNSYMNNIYLLEILF